jgi:two-component system, sensor histidine kinase and response regulator
MPEMDGEQALSAIRGLEELRDRHTPIVALTAHAMAGDKERCLSLGFDGYVAKPIRPEILFGVIDELVTQARAGAAAAATSGPRSAKRCAAPGAAAEVPPAADVHADLSLPQLDESELLARVDGDRSLVGELIELSAADARATLSELGAAIARGDATAVARSAHRLKGMTANLGGRRAAALAARLEQEGRSGELPHASAIVAALGREWPELQAKLQALATQASG